MRALAILAVVLLAFLAAALLLQTGWNSVAGALSVGRLSLSHAFGLALGVSALSWLADASKQKNGGGA